MSSSSARRRHALREFYKLQDESSRAEPINHQHNESIDSDKIFLQSDIDQPGITVASYVSQLVATSDVKSLLSLENELYAQLKALESEQKALVYNNYNKLISAAETLENLHAKSDFSKSHELQDSLSEVSSIVKKLQTTDNHHHPNKDTNEDADTTEKTAGEIRSGSSPLVNEGVSKWLQACDITITALLSAGDKKDAHDLAKAVLEKLSNLTVSDQQALIRSKLEGLVMGGG